MNYVSNEKLKDLVNLLESRGLYSESQLIKDSYIVKEAGAPLAWLAGILWGSFKAKVATTTVVTIGGSYAAYKAYDEYEEVSPKSYSREVLKTDTPTPIEPETPEQIFEAFMSWFMSFDIGWGFASRPVDEKGSMSALLSPVLTWEEWWRKHWEKGEVPSENAFQEMYCLQTTGEGCSWHDFFHDEDHPIEFFKISLHAKQALQSQTEKSVEAARFPPYKAQAVEELTAMRDDVQAKLLEEGLLEVPQVHSMIQTFDQYIEDARNSKSTNELDSIVRSLRVYADTLQKNAKKKAREAGEASRQTQTVEPQEQTMVPATQARRTPEDPPPAQPKKKDYPLDPFGQ